MADPGLAQLARGFPGPWPSLTLLAGAAGIADRQLRNLRHYTLRQLALVNDQVAHSGPRMLGDGDVPHGR